MIDAILAHAAECQPAECCGLIVAVDGIPQYRPCRNLALRPGRFALHPADWADAEDAGTIMKIVHSHVYQSAAPSDADRVGCEASGLPWLIVSWPTGQRCEIAPSGYQAPLLGREFVWGIFDCFTLIRDYYRQELGLLIDDFGGYQEDFWKDGTDHYTARFAAAGFREVFELRPHDVLLLSLPIEGGNGVPQHAAIYQQPGVILHHLQGRLSCRNPYGGLWQSLTRKSLRHSSLFDS